MTYGTFLSYVVPAVLAMALSGVYALVDGFFVGNRIGDPGLSAINFAYPVTAFLEAVGTGIGMGGAVHYALSMGRGRRELARQYGAAALWGLLAAGARLVGGCCRTTPETVRRLAAAREAWKKR